MQAKLPLPFFLVSLSVFIIAFTALFVSQVHATSTTSITITSFPSTGSVYVTVDGYALATPATFTWNVGDTHTIAANSPVTIAPDQSRYIYSGWSDGGEQSHTIIVASQATTYTANFQLQYHLSVSGGNGISYSNPQPGNWYDSGTSTTVSSNWLQSVQGNTTGLVGSWHFDEGTGTRAYDSSGNGNNGTIYGVAWVAGKCGNALSFDGIDDNVALSNQVTGILTATAWVYKNDTSAAVVLGKSSSHPYCTIFNFWSSNTLIYVGDGVSAEYGFEVSAFNFVNQWHFLAVTLSGTTMTLFVDGQSVGSQTFSSSSLSPIDTIGEYGAGGNYPFKGIIDEVRIYNRALNPSETTSLYYSRMAVTNWQLDGVNQNPTRQNTGTLTTSSITMNSNHTVTFLSTTQYYLTVNGGYGVSYGTASQTSDSWYDSGTSTTVSTNWVWGAVESESRMAVTSWQLDGVNQNPARQGSGTLTTSSINISTYHTLDFVSVTQYRLTVSGALMLYHLRRRLLGILSMT